jgi:RNA polymerase sigma factor (sigma-70 family)
MGNDEQSDDVELLKDLTSNPSALETFYRRHIADVTRFLAGRCWTPEDLADAVSATFLAVLLSASSFNPMLGSPRAWLFTIARNEARGQGRSLGRRECLRLRLQGSVLLSQDDSERLTELIDAEHTVANLEETLRDAPEGEKQLLLSIVTNDISVAEASRALGISAVTGRKRMERLRDRVATHEDVTMVFQPAPINPSPSEKL